MASSRLKSDELFVGIVFICLLTTILCLMISISNLPLYSKYQQVKLQQATFSLIIQCHIDKIIVREITNSNDNSSWTIIESKFIISIIHPLNNTKQNFEESTVPLSLYNTVVNNSYPCYVDPMDNEQRPLKSAPDVFGARHEFIWRTFVPALIATPGIILFIITFIVAIIDKCQIIIASRPRGFFRIRTHPTSTT
ncbi:unnamed protein product [Rotaria sordida]|uniref:Uncharacterized protein n=1 Tax=Rotaria sordida TaxID=392033 RepID=A0A814KH92_9BILA|nr:unnamed protein product [Rotaria sordida]CAF0912956.1 unnamed protein product [Rotaria sordida]CAF0931152.1 unnamed protein product [Rotaria sordida]CAF0984575.1 unnamed protein product [Rotaria sordida]CAF0985772.1 unnamed protein product [Rotaria sordida]